MTKAPRIKNKECELEAARLSHLSGYEIAREIAAKPPQAIGKTFRFLSLKLAADTFDYLPLKTQVQLFSLLPIPYMASILEIMSPDDRTVVLEMLPEQEAHKYINLLSEEERHLTLTLLGYPEDQVGHYMTTDYLAIKMDWTVEKVLEHIRKYGHDSETINVIFVIDNEGHLIDDVKIKDLLFVPKHNKVSQVTDGKFVALSAHENAEKAINVFKEHDRIALPVLDAHKKLVGIVTIDDILRLAAAESTEDMQKIGGTEALEEPYMDTPFIELMKKRSRWLIILFLGELFTATAMSYFEVQIAKAVVLALFLPLIISSGGNAGSQSSTLIIRAMALGEIKLKDWWIVMRREIYSGLFLGFLLGIIGFFRVTIWANAFNMYGDHWELIALTIFLALIGVVLWGTLMGAMLPLALRRLGADPATSSAPLVATLVDVTGITIYFCIAIVVLRGTLLAS